MSAASKKLHATVVKLFGDIACGDGACIFGHPGGMQTNGGCRCLSDLNIAGLRQKVLQMRAVAIELAKDTP